MFPVSPGLLVQKSPREGQALPSRAVGCISVGAKLGCRYSNGKAGPEQESHSGHLEADIHKPVNFDVQHLPFALKRDAASGRKAVE